jgi:hypothetical protein
MSKSFSPESFSWTENDGVISLTLPPTSGIRHDALLSYLSERRILVQRQARAKLLSADFVPAAPGTIHCVKIFRGTALPDGCRTTRIICSKAPGSRWQGETACLLGAVLTPDVMKKMGFECVVAMNDPALDCDPSAIGTFSVWRSAFGRSIDTLEDSNPDIGWNSEFGFALIK